MAQMTPQRPLNVLCVSLTDMLNGAERVMLELADGMDRTRFRPFVVAPAEGAVSRAARARGIETWIVRAPRWLPFAHDDAPASYHWRRYWTEAARYVDPLVSLIERHHIDVVYSASGTILHGALAALISGRAHVHHLQENLGDSRLGLVMPRRNARHAYRLIGALSSRVVCISGASRRDVADAVESSRLQIVPLGFRSMPSDTGVMPLPGPDGPRIQVGVVGGVWQPKGADLIVPIVRRVCETMPHVHFYWLGPGDRAAMQRLSAASVMNGVPHLHFLGYADNVWPFMRAIDFLLHPSHSECFPRVLMEAACAGRPSIATRCGGSEEIIQDGVSGLLAPVGDVNGLAEHVIRLASDLPLASRMGREAASRAAKFPMDAFVERMQTVFADAYAAGPVVRVRGIRTVLSGLVRLPSLVLAAARAMHLDVIARAVRHEQRARRFGWQGHGGSR